MGVCPAGASLRVSRIMCKKRLRCAASSSVKLGWSCDNMKDTPPRELSSVWGGICGPDTDDSNLDVISARARAHERPHTHTVDTSNLDMQSDTVLTATSLLPESSTSLRHYYSSFILFYLSVQKRGGLRPRAKHQEKRNSRFGCSTG